MSLILSFVASGYNLIPMEKRVLFETKDAAPLSKIGP